MADPAIMTTRISRRRDASVSVKVNLQLNAKEIIAIDDLLASGLYGYTRPQVVRRLFDERLVELYLTQKGPSRQWTRQA